MWTFDRIILIALALGIWTFVLKPNDISARGEGHSHNCKITGKAYGDKIGSTTVEIREWKDVIVRCDKR